MLITDVQINKLNVILYCPERNPDCNGVIPLIFLIPQLWGERSKHVFSITINC